MTESTTCGGEGCTCEAGPSGYCSDHCARRRENAPGDTSSQQCGCGHSDCETVPAAG